MTNKLKILFLEDNVFDYELICRHLKRSSVDFEPKHVHTREEYVLALDEFKPDIILSDHRLPQFDSISALEIAQEKKPLTPFVLVTGSVSEEFAATCIKKGAFDYVLKDNLIRLSNAVNTAIDRKYLVDENTSIKSLVKELESAHKVIADKNKDIVDSINYAGKIQSAILPSFEKIQVRFPGSFVMFKPKDIIGGDFYWYAEKDNQLFIAVADCTGHGVPGSMLSMIGHNLLNTAVYVQELNDPADILYKINNELRRIMSKGDRSKQRLRDGMDIGLIVINKDNDNVEFAGARRPIYGFQNGKLDTIRGTSFSLGESKLDQNIFVTHRFKLHKYESVYLTTDGYADQFGGERNKKITTKKFKELLIETNRIKKNPSKLLKDFFNHWSGRNDQTDDVLVMGIDFRMVNHKSGVLKSIKFKAHKKEKV